MVWSTQYPPPEKIASLFIILWSVWDDGFFLNPLSIMKLLSAFMWAFRALALYQILNLDLLGNTKSILLGMNSAKKIAALEKWVFQLLSHQNTDIILNLWHILRTMEPTLSLLYEAKFDIFSDMLEIKCFAYSLPDPGMTSFCIMWNLECTTLTFDRHKITLDTIHSMFKTLLTNTLSQLFVDLLLRFQPSEFFKPSGWLVQCKYWVFLIIQFCQSIC